MGNSSTQNAGSHSKSQSSEEEASRKTYEVTELPALKEKDTFARFTSNDFTLKYQEYYPINFTTQNQSTIYAIAWREPGKEIDREYFINEQDRNEHIKTLHGYLNYQECSDSVFNDETGVAATQHLEQRCQIGEFFPYTLNIQSMTLYIIIFRKDKTTGLQFDYWKDEAMRSRALTTNTHYGQYVNLLDREAKPAELNQTEIQEFEQSKAHITLAQFCRDQIPPNFLLGDTIKKKDKNTLYYPLACAGEQAPRYFTTEEARNKAVEEYKEQCAALDAQTRDTIISKNLNTLITKDQMYFKTEYELNGKKLFVIIYQFTNKNEKILTYKTFPSLENRQTFLKNNKPFVELGIASATSQSKNGQAQIKVSKQHVDFLQSQAAELAKVANGGEKEYATFNVPSTSDPSTTIYALAFSEKSFAFTKYQPKVELFNSLGQRQTYIDKQLKDYNYSEKIKLDQVFNGAPADMLGDPGLKKALHADHILIRPGDTFTFEFQANNKTLYAWATLNNGKLDVHYAENETARTAKFVNREPPIKDRTKFINSLDHKALEETKERLFKEKNIESECPNRLNVWLEEGIEVKGQKVDICFNRGLIADKNHPIGVWYSESGTIWPMIQQNIQHSHTDWSYKLKSPTPQDRNAFPIQDPKISAVPQNLETDDELDEATGKAMLTQSWSQKDLELKELALFKKEYIRLEVKTKAVFPLLSRNESEQVNYRYFKTEEARDKHIKNSLPKYINSWLRHRSSECYVILRAVEYLKTAQSSTATAQALVYTIFVPKDSKKAHIVAIKYDATNQNAKNDVERCVIVTSCYCSSSKDDLKKVGDAILAQGTPCVDMKHFDYKLSPTETAYAIDNTKNKVQPLAVKEFIRKSYLGYYVVVFVRHADENGQPKSEERAYLVSDPESLNYTTSLKDKGYQEK